MHDVPTLDMEQARALFRQFVESVPARTSDQRIADRCAGEDRLPGPPGKIDLPLGAPDRSLEVDDLASRSRCR